MDNLTGTSGPFLIMPMENRRCIARLGHSAWTKEFAKPQLDKLFGAVTDKDIRLRNNFDAIMSEP
jgi:hypothetical protein